MIPEYKFKQGSKLPNVSIENYFKKHFTPALDEYLQDDIIDLRAGFYEKFYTIKAPYLTFKFLKNGKVVSHWAKAYRGIVLRHLARHRFASIRELLASDIPGLHINEIREKRQKTEVVYDIIQA